MIKHFISINQDKNRYRAYKIEKKGNDVFTSNSRLKISEGKYIVTHWMNTFKSKETDINKLVKKRLKRGYIEHPIYLLEFEQLSLFL